MADPDLPLIEALKAGEDLALNKLIQRHREALYFFAFRYLHDESAARDVVQETFVRVYFKASSFEPKSSVKTWLYTIAANLSRDRLRWLGKRHHVSLDAPTEAKALHRELSAAEPNPSEQTATRERFDELQHAIDQLPDRLRRPLILCTLEGQSHKEAGGILDLTPKAVELRIYHAKAKLREILGDSFKENVAGD